MIQCGDLFDVLPTLAAESLDACVTDPPYELAFMGKKWDGTGVAFKPETWAAVLRVLKPGAHLLAFGGDRTHHRLVTAIEAAGFDIRTTLVWIFGQGFPKSLNLGNGLGTALKPAMEQICMARKPLVGTVAATIQRFGTGALNIDACRIEGEVAVPFGVRRSEVNRTGYGPYGSDTGVGGGFDGSDWTPHSQGRWPANVLLDEDAASLLDEQSGELPAGWFSGTEKRGLGFMGAASHADGSQPARSTGDAGGASRFFYTAKPSAEERNYGIREGRSMHPTVKPVALMRWLVKLVTPPDGCVLDPFMGSGTTGMACRYEHRRFAGIEREPEYFAIADARIRAVAPLFGEA